METHGEIFAWYDHKENLGRGHLACAQIGYGAPSIAFPLSKRPFFAHAGARSTGVANGKDVNVRMLNSD